MPLYSRNNWNTNADQIGCPSLLRMIFWVPRSIGSRSLSERYGSWEFFVETPRYLRKSHGFGLRSPIGSEKEKVDDPYNIVVCSFSKQEIARNG